MISIRPFEERDNGNLLEIEALCPQGNDKCAMCVRKKDAISRYRIYDTWNVIVAEVDGKVAGWTGWMVKEDPLKRERYIYLAEVMVHPDFRRMGIASRLVEEAERWALVEVASYIYCYIYEPNTASTTLFSALGYSNETDVKQVEMPVYKRGGLSASFSPEHIKNSEIDEAVKLINEYNSGYRHFVPFSAESFAKHLQSIPGYGPDNYWICKERNRVVACAGIWDCSTIAEFCYTRQPSSWKIIGALFKLLGMFTKVPKMVNEGEYFQFHFLVDYAFDRKNPEAMQSLLQQIKNEMLDDKRDYLVAVLEQEDPIFSLLKKGSPQLETTHLFVKSLTGALPELNPLYVDIRDMIL